MLRLDTITYIDFRPLIIKLSESVQQLSVITADKAYDSEEDNHVLVVRDVLHALSVIPARYEHVPIRKTHGRYRKQIDEAWWLLLQITVQSKKQE